jgi:hypothetical protein
LRLESPEADPGSGVQRGADLGEVLCNLDSFHRLAKLQGNLGTGQKATQDLILMWPSNPFD